MSDTTIKSINSVQPTDSGALYKSHDTTSGQAVDVQKLPSSEQETPSVQEEKNIAVKNDLAKISLHFSVDDETQELTVFIVDRSSKRVLRSIPPNELYKLQAGDLLKLTA